ncbi:MAG: metal ABC transporter permease, partial [Actinomycetota bacterium]
VVAGVAFIAIARPLLLATFEATEARAMGIPVDALNVVFVVLLALVVAATSQITGALLVFALLVMPGATAQVLTPKVWRGCAIAVGLGLFIIWVGIGLSFFLPRLPLGFCVTSVGFTAYVVARVLVALRSRPHLQGALA